MSFWKTRQFKKLHHKWNKKLSASGFIDAENEHGALKQRASNSYRQASSLERETRLDYYLKIGSEINRTQFENDIDRLIMLLHSDGASIEEIVSQIQKQGHKRHRETIRLTIRKYLITWEMKPINVWPQMSRKKSHIE